jgi:hypothetical protein
MFSSPSKSLSETGLTKFFQTLCDLHFDRTPRSKIKLTGSAEKQMFTNRSGDSSYDETAALMLAKATGEGVNVPPRTANNPDPRGGFYALGYHELMISKGNPAFIDGNSFIWKGYIGRPCEDSQYDCPGDVKQKLMLWDASSCLKERKDVPCVSRPNELHTLESEDIRSISLRTAPTTG